MGCICKHVGLRICLCLVKPKPKILLTANCERASGFTGASKAFSQPRQGHQQFRGKKLHFGLRRAETKQIFNTSTSILLDSNTNHSTPSTFSMSFQRQTQCKRVRGRLNRNCCPEIANGFLQPCQGIHPRLSCRHGKRTSNFPPIHCTLACAALKQSQVFKHQHC